MLWASLQSCWKLRVPCGTGKQLERFNPLRAGPSVYLPCLISGLLLSDISHWYLLVTLAWLWTQPNSISQIFLPWLCLPAFFSELSLYIKLFWAENLSWLNPPSSSIQDFVMTHGTWQNEETNREMSLSWNAVPWVTCFTSHKEGAEIKENLGWLYQNLN